MLDKFKNEFFYLKISNRNKKWQTLNYLKWL